MFHCRTRLIVGVFVILAGTITTGCGSLSTNDEVTVYKRSSWDESADISEIPRTRHRIDFERFRFSIFPSTQAVVVRSLTQPDVPLKLDDCTVANRDNWDCVDRDGFPVAMVDGDFKTSLASVIHRNRVWTVDPDWPDRSNYEAEYIGYWEWLRHFLF